jgi:hypothetical protein
VKLYFVLKVELELGFQILLETVPAKQTRQTGKEYADHALSPGFTNRAMMADIRSQL